MDIVPRLSEEAVDRRVVLVKDTRNRAFARILGNSPISSVLDDIQKLME